MNKLLTAYWFEFENYHPVGVTGYSVEDAKSLIKEKVFPKQEFPKILSVIEGIQVKDLDQNHVVPNMGPMVLRVVWYPNLLNY